MGKNAWYDDRIPARYTKAAENIMKTVMRRTRWSVKDRDALAEHLLTHFDFKPPRITSLDEQKDGETNEHAT